MNVYTLLRYFFRIKSRRLRLAGLWLFHVTGRRYLGAFFDPVVACNLRCRMCYFSGKEGRAVQPPMEWGQVERIADALFHRVMKMQLGCGAEPTLYPRLVELVELCKRKGVPYVSLTSNGKLLTADLLNRLAAAGLDELTLSAHGLTASTYESLMPRGFFADFRRVLRDVTLLKERYPGFKLRVNYTVNEDNWRDLLQFATVFADVPVDVVQIRPVQNLGDSDYRNFSLDAIARHYDEVFPPLVDFCRRRSIVLFYPLPGHLQALADDSHAESQPVQDYAYCYISPNCCWKSDFRYMEEDFEAYCRRRRTGRELWGAIWRKRKTAGAKWTTRALNYDVK